MKKISFCITCRNRTYHLQKTLIQNIEDNFLMNEADFLLLDYGSDDGLGEWIKSEMQAYILTGMLTYYKYEDAQFYHRAHSRNLIIRLANTPFVCNLDADNYLGEGFAAYIIKELENNNKTFYTSDYSFRDIVGRVCLRKSDFINVRGYNETMAGYGFEDIDLFKRLKQLGLRQANYNDPEYYKVIRHSNEERIAQEYIYLNMHSIFINYISPFEISILLLYKDLSCEIGSLRDNMQLNYNIFDLKLSLEERCQDERFQVVKSNVWRKGRYYENEDTISIVMKNHDKIGFMKTQEGLFSANEGCYYKIEDHELKVQLVFLITGALNFQEMNKSINQYMESPIVNLNGFGTGVVYKNFDYSSPIIVQ